MDNIRIGTRGSELALWQARHIQHLLRAKDIDSRIVIIETTGDKILEVSIAKIGSKGVFTEQIEEQLAQGSIDIAVHSAKDMQSTLPEGFELIAFTGREIVDDVLVSHLPEVTLTNDCLIGTSSVRRIALLKRYYPQVRTVPVRGNLQTRIKKMREGACDALMLAYAGMSRMGYGELIKMHFSTDRFTPAVGQGSIAVECASALDSRKKQQIRAAVNHSETEMQLLAERAFLKILDGGCSIPVFGLATIENDRLTLKGGVVGLEGKRIIRKELSGSADSPQAIGEQLAGQVLAAGGKQVLSDIKKRML